MQKLYKIRVFYLGKHVSDLEYASDDKDFPLLVNDWSSDDRWKYVITSIENDYRDHSDTSIRRWCGLISKYIFASEVIAHSRAAMLTNYN